MAKVANGDANAIGQEIVGLQRNMNKLLQRTVPPSQNAWGSVDINDRSQFPQMGQQRPQTSRAAAPEAAAPESAPVDLNQYQERPTVGEIAPAGAGFSSAGYRYALILSALTCQAAEYDMAVFRETMDAMCKKNGVCNLQLVDLSEKTIDHLCGGKNPSGALPDGRRTPNPESRVPSPVSLCSRSTTIRSDSPRSKSESEDRGSLSYSPSHLSGLSGSPLKGLSPSCDLQEGYLDYPESPPLKEPSFLPTYNGSEVYENRFSLSSTPQSGTRTQEAVSVQTQSVQAQKTESIATPRRETKKTLPSQDLFSSYDENGSKKKESPSSAPAERVSSTPISESQGLAALGAGTPQSPQKSEGSLGSSPSNSHASSGSTYSSVSQKSAPELEKGPEAVLDALKVSKVPLEKLKVDKRAILQGKDFATASQVLAALRRKEVAIPGGRSHRILALLNGASRYPTLEHEKLEIKWSRSKTQQWQK